MHFAVRAKDREIVVEPAPANISTAAAALAYGDVA